MLIIELYRGMLYSIKIKKRGIIVKDEKVKAKSDHTNKTAPKKLEQKGQESQIEETLSVFVSESKGIIQTKNLTELGIHPEQFQRYLKKVGKSKNLLTACMCVLTTLPMNCNFCKPASKEEYFHMKQPCTYMI